jgi:predicted PurR-regulated permease PerM
MAENVTEPHLRHPLLPTLLFAALFLLSAALMAYVASPFRVPLFLAAVLASVCFSFFERVSRKLGQRPHLAAALFTLAFVLLLIGPIAWIAVFAAQQTVAGLAFVRDTMGVHSLADLNTTHLPPSVATLVEKIGRVFPISQAQIQSSFAQLERTVQEAVPQVLGASSRIAFHSLIMVFAFYFFLVDAPRLLRWLWQISPLENRQTQELLSDFQKVLRATFVGLLATAIIQGVLITAAYAIADVPFPLFFGLLTALGLFVPVIGTALVWVPVSGLLALSGHLGAGAILFG